MGSTVVGLTGLELTSRFRDAVPELVVDWTAIRRGASALAIGDLFGSSLVDATLSVGIGPLVRATAVSEEAMMGTLVIAAGCALATMIAVFEGPPRPTAVALFALYVGTTIVLVTLAS